MKEVDFVQAIADCTGDDSALESVSMVGGGSINQCFKVTTGAGSYFLKLNDAEKYPFMFEREMEGLGLLSKASRFLPCRSCSRV